MSNNIAGKVVVITRASSGLGEATARLLSAQGASLAPGARRIDRLKSLENELNKGGGKTLAVATDVTSSEQVKQLVDTAAQKFGRVDVIINNAGLSGDYLRFDVKESQTPRGNQLNPPRTQSPGRHSP
jgi:NADP-dependent 3-hydroxy acid dehydrogenase YdfG